MSTRLQIILISAIALMAALGFAATQMIRGTVGTSIRDGGAQETDQIRKIEQAIQLLPSTTEVLAIHPMSPTKFWVLSEESSGDSAERTWQTWSIDIDTRHATALRNISAITELALQSFNIVSSTEFRDEFIVRLNAAWEGPTHQQMQVVHGKTGEEIVFVDWFSVGWPMRIQKGGQSLEINWHLPTPCELAPSQTGTASADGILVNGTVIPFQQVKEIKCWFNDFGGEIEYEGFEEPTYQTEYPDLQFVTFRMPDGDSINVSLETFSPDGVTIQSREP